MQWILVCCWCYYARWWPLWCMLTCSRFNVCVCVCVSWCTDFRTNCHIMDQVFYAVIVFTTTGTYSGVFFPPSCTQLAECSATIDKNAYTIYVFYLNWYSFIAIPSPFAYPDFYSSFRIHNAIIRQKLDRHIDLTFFCVMEYDITRHICQNNRRISKNVSATRSCTHSMVTLM